MKKVLLSIGHCKECRYLKREQSPYTGDSFDMADEDWKCTKKNRYVVVSERWGLDRLPIPEWCPLPTVSASKA